MIDLFQALGSFIMTPLYYVTSFVLLAFHRLWGGIFGPETGLAWVLSIIGLTLVIRAALIPLFVKQIKSSRNMQLIQPKVRELQKKYGHDRERLAQETMKLYKETGTNPFASCLPILLQMPIFLALFRLIDQAAKDPSQERGFMTETLNKQFGDAVFLGAKISDTFVSTDELSVRVLAAFLVIAMTATTFLTQRQLMSKNMPADAMSGPYAQQQKMLLYVLPLVFAVGGIAFPIGVLFYWTTSNLWTMCQQFYVIRNNPAPGTPAEAAKKERDAHKAQRKAERHGGVVEESPAPEVEEKPAPPVQRQQPRKQSRSQRKKQGGTPRSQDPQPKPGDEEPGPSQA
ncbi:membrane protein insertase YidC [Nocardioides iriomotensis]|uniref:Membrane protein insertase YidC n=1 Tax=Nocardioides iriomotensis TaxID=715784 RepID=A0A4Q5IYV2_9ACTN|nr:membrane protein insertase YidC [Nocardioides iriomotensis]RYU10241.1 membrane protein insertase YidC [Nocardioides iriomotensis]